MTAAPGPDLRLPPRGAGEYGGETYYGLPAVKRSHYRWLTALAFFLEGMGGASQFLATAAERFGRGRHRAVVRAGRYLALFSALASPGLLIAALHTPRRWFNMLRIFRKTSPMSIGTWSLSAFGLFSGVAAAGQLLEDLGARRPGRWLARTAGVPAALAGGVVSLYIGTELEETATPLWSSAHPVLSPLYAAAAASTGSSALLLLAEGAGAPPHTCRALNALSAAAGAAQLALGRRVARAWDEHPGARVARQGPWRTAFRGGVLGCGVALPLAVRFVHAVSGMRSRRLSALASVGSLAGGILLPAVTLLAGNASGDRPRDYFRETARETDPARGRGSVLTWTALSVGAGILTALVAKRRKSA